ncbi:hypothetical protein HU200_028731 [Digitaria exilis]|uniref:Uncharacterized protein n=1 Tax=Digitaria exilis TaxID=1010633 RepID=A0A835BVV7_9POAL|nr:hypothetical protein HU200_028731 [Digitaria exilis]
MMLPPWNNFLRSLFYFVVVRSYHDEGLVRINLPMELITFGFEEEKERQKKEEDLGQLHLATVLWARVLSHCLLSVCLYSQPYEPSYKFGIEI